MNFYVILHAIIGASVVIARPVDVNNDDRPLINYISPQDAENLSLRTGVLELEGIPSKGLSFYDQSQQKFGQLFKGDAEPIVDTIKEEEKYGNDGYRPWDYAIVNTLEKVSVFVNGVIETPKAWARSFAGVVTEKLNQFGGMLVGL